jgi:hypothetical protein
MLKVVLDTSIFINPDSYISFGDNPREALNNFLEKVKDKKIFCYMPPSVYKELMKFMEEEISSQRAILIYKKPPSSYQSGIPALFLYEFIEDMRYRINKGLRIAEKYSRRALKKVDKEDEIINHLREEYRSALREGIIDSREDFDLILLAKELGGHLATSDKGLIKWAQKLGIICLNAEELKEILKTCPSKG